MNEPRPLVIANHKANNTWDQVGAWLDEVAPHASTFKGTVIMCPSNPFLAASFQKITSANMRIKLGAQDISQFQEGAHTGETAASQIADICKYAIIGHSERRKELGETEEVLEKKVTSAKAAHVEPIFCVQNEDTPIPQGVTIVAYEPPSAIGTGSPDDPKNIERVVGSIKQKGQFTVLYGGSVSGDNIEQFLSAEGVDGVLVGVTNSLEPQKFIAILKNAN